MSGPTPRPHDRPRRGHEHSPADQILIRQALEDAYELLAELAARGMIGWGGIDELGRALEAARRMARGRAS